MSIIGFNFTKINAEKKKGASGKVNIKNNVTITDVSEKDLSFAPNQKGIQFNFEFTTVYDPDFGEILLGGEVIFLEEQARGKEIMDLWKKSKKTDKLLTLQLYNNILMKCQIQAMVLSQTINLPPPIRLPRVTIGPEAPAKPSKK